MRIRVQLAEQLLAWRFHGLDSLADYIASRPWLGKPAIEIVRVADEASAAAVLAAIEDECLLASRDGGAVRAHVVPAPAVVERGPVAALAACLDLHGEMGDLEAATAVGTEAAVASRLFLFPPLPSDRPQLRSELEQFADLVTKVESLARFAVVCLDTPACPLGGRCHDLIDGLIPAPTDLLSATEAAAWRIYLHHRIAWETGGRLADAVALEGQLTSGGLPVGADQALEDRLVKAATKRFALLDAAIRSSIETGVRKSSAREDLTGSFSTDHFWSPTETAGLLPRPWVARALLAAEPDRQHAELLRNCLVCVPLGQALLAACCVFETQVRGRIRLPSAPDSSAPCVGQWQTFTSAGSLERSLFPAAGPAVPTSPWEFASFGEYLTNEIVRDRSSNWRHDMRVVRNHLAHGHHVGWSVVRTLRTLSERVALG
jgi:hypothetical protein